jgi:hypothetical protein
MDAEDLQSLMERVNMYGEDSSDDDVGAAARVRASRHVAVAQQNSAHRGDTLSSSNAAAGGVAPIDHDAALAQTEAAEGSFEPYRDDGDDDDDDDDEQMAYGESFADPRVSAQQLIDQHQQAQRNQKARPSPDDEDGDGGEDMDYDGLE